MRYFDLFEVWQLEEETTTFDFAGTTTDYPEHSVKIALSIRDWPFKSLAHTLKVAITTGADTGDTTCVTEGTDDGGSLRWVKVILDNLYLYPL